MLTSSGCTNWILHSQTVNGKEKMNTRSYNLRSAERKPTGHVNDEKSPKRKTNKLESNLTAVPHLSPSRKKKPKLSRRKVLEVSNQNDIVPNENISNQILHRQEHRRSNISVLEPVTVQQVVTDKPLTAGVKTSLSDTSLSMSILGAVGDAKSTLENNEDIDEDVYFDTIPGKPSADDDTLDHQNPNLTTAYLVDAPDKQLCEETPVTDAMTQSKYLGQHSPSIQQTGVATNVKFDSNDDDSKPANFALMNYFKINEIVISTFGIDRFPHVISGNGTFKEKLCLEEIIASVQAQTELKQDSLANQYYSTKSSSLDSKADVAEIIVERKQNRDIVEIENNGLKNSLMNDRISNYGDLWQSHHIFLPQQFEAENSILANESVSNNTKELLEKAEKYLNSESLAYHITNTASKLTSHTEKAIVPIFNTATEVAKASGKRPFNESIEGDRATEPLAKRRIYSRPSLFESRPSSNISQFSSPAYSRALSESTPQLQVCNSLLNSAKETPTTLNKNSTRSNCLFQSATKRSALSFIERRKYEQQKRSTTKLSGQSFCNDSNYTAADNHATTPSDAISAVVAKKILSSLTANTRESQHAPDMKKYEFLPKLNSKITATDPTSNSDSQEVLVFQNKLQQQNQLQQYASKSNNPAIDVAAATLTSITRLDDRKLSSTQNSNAEFTFKKPTINYYAEPVHFDQTPKSSTKDYDIKFVFSPPNEKSQHHGMSSNKFFTNLDLQACTTKVENESLEKSELIKSGLNTSTNSSVTFDGPNSKIVDMRDGLASNSAWALALSSTKVKCTVCFVPNEPSAIKCISCESDLPIDGKQCNGTTSVQTRQQKQLTLPTGSIDSTGFTFGATSTGANKGINSAGLTVDAGTKIVASKDPTVGINFVAPMSQLGTTAVGHNESCNAASSLTSPKGPGTTYSGTSIGFKFEPAKNVSNPTLELGSIPTSNAVATSGLYTLQPCNGTTLSSQNIAASQAANTLLSSGIDETAKRPCVDFNFQAISKKRTAGDNDNTSSSANSSFASTPFNRTAATPFIFGINSSEAVVPPNVVDSKHVSSLPSTTLPTQSPLMFGKIDALTASSNSNIFSFSPAKSLPFTTSKLNSSAGNSPSSTMDTGYQSGDGAIIAAPELTLPASSFSTTFPSFNGLLMNNPNPSNSSFGIAFPSNFTNNATVGIALPPITSHFSASNSFGGTTPQYPTASNQITPSQPRLIGDDTSGFNLGSTKTTSTMVNGRKKVKAKRP